LFRKNRPGQVRGVPEYVSSLRSFGEMRDYTHYVMGAAKAAAALSVILETQAAPEDPDEVEPLDVFDLEIGQIMTNPKGWVAKQMKAEQPTTAYGEFARERLNESA